MSDMEKELKKTKEELEKTKEAVKALAAVLRSTQNMKDDTIRNFMNEAYRNLGMPRL